MTTKIRLVLIMFIVIGLLSGCNDNTDAQTNHPDDSNESNSKKVRSYYEYTPNAYQPYWNDPDIKKVENGYYYLIVDMLYFFDTSSKTAYLACPSPDCDHNGEHCNAFLGSYGDHLRKGFLPLMLDVVDEYLYVMGYDMSEVTDVYLYRISRDGTRRDKLFYLYSSDTNCFTSMYTMHMNYFYNVVIEEGKAYLERISLDNKREIVFDLSEYYDEFVSIDNVSGYGDYIYFNAVWREGKEQKFKRLYRYHITTNELEIVLDDFICNEFQLIDDAMILYMDLDFNIFKKDTKTGEETIIYSTNSDYFQFSYDGVYLYTVYPSNEYVEVYDLEGNKIDTIEIKGGTCLFGDSEYLIVKSMDPPAGMENVPEFSFYALPKNQIGTAKKEWILLEGYDN